MHEVKDSRSHPACHPGNNTSQSLAIVTPCLNVVGTIDQTIQSVISQAGEFSIHYHIQDGGSNDGTVERLKHWEKTLSGQKSPVKCCGVSFTWVSKADQGMYDAIAKGFDVVNAAPADFMAWINGDDILLPNTLATITRIAMDHPGIEWIGSPTYVIDRAGKKVGGSPNLTPTTVIREGLCDGGAFHWRHLQQEGTFFKKSLWLKAKHVLTGYKLAGDWALWRESARHAEYYQCEKPLGAFRKLDGQLSISRRDEYNAEVEAALPMKKRDESFQRLFDQRHTLQANLIRVSTHGGKTVLERVGVADRLMKSEVPGPASVTERQDMIHLEAARNSPIACEQHASAARSALSYGQLLDMAAEINRTTSADPTLTDVFVLGCSSRVLTDSTEFLAHYQGNEQFRLACRTALSLCRSKYSESMRKFLELKGFSLVVCKIEDERHK